MRCTMPRPPRIWFPGALYHVMVRGDNREPIFFNDADRRSFLARLARAKHEYDCQLWAYVLMTNHVHLMLRTGDVHPISTFTPFMVSDDKLATRPAPRLVSDTDISYSGLTPEQRLW